LQLYSRRPPGRSDHRKVAAKAHGGEADVKLAQRAAAAKGGAQSEPQAVHVRRVASRTPLALAHAR
jgi:hypothetical protein